jgi:hypothetical protein
MCNMFELIEPYDPNKGREYRWRRLYIVCGTTAAAAAGIALAFVLPGGHNHNAAPVAKAPSLSAAPSPEYAQPEPGVSHVVTQGDQTNFTITLSKNLVQQGQTPPGFAMQEITSNGALEPRLLSNIGLTPQQGSDTLAGWAALPASIPSGTVELFEEFGFQNGSSSVVGGVESTKDGEWKGLTQEQAAAFLLQAGGQ